MGAVAKYFEPGGVGSKGVGTFFQGGDTGGVFVLGGDVGTNPRIERALSSFQHMVARRLTSRKPRRQGGGSWEYPSLEEAMVEAGFEGIGTYITRR